MADGRSRIWAKLFLVLAFPIWFPRLLCWMAIEFFRVHIGQWLSSPDEFYPSPLANKQQAPILAVIQGEFHDPLPYPRGHRRVVSQAALRLVHSNPQGRTFSPDPPAYRRTKAF